MGGQLPEFNIGVAVMILAINPSGKISEKERLRLESMGILPGTEISILTKGAGSLIVAVGDSRVILQREVAENIVVA